MEYDLDNTQQNGNGTDAFGKLFKKKLVWLFWLSAMKQFV